MIRRIVTIGAVAAVLPLAALTGAADAQVPGPVPGTPDPAFGGDGRVDVDLGTAPSAGSLLAAKAPDGSTLVLASSVLSRFRPDGTLDPTFADGGELQLDLGGDLLALRPGGGVYILVGVYPTSELRVQAVTADGELDPTFGGGDGRADLYGIYGTRPTALAVTADDELLVATGWADRVASAYVTRIDHDGEIDTAFGGGDGRIDLATDPAAGGYLVDDLLVAADGSITTAGVWTYPLTWDSSVELARFTADGAPIARNRLFDRDVLDAVDLVVDGNGWMLGITRGSATRNHPADPPGPGRATVVRIGPSLAVDPAWGGAQGIAISAPATSTYVAGLARQADGTLGVALSVDHRLPPQYPSGGHAAVARVSATGGVLGSLWMPDLDARVNVTGLVGADLLIGNLLVHGFATGTAQPTATRMGPVQDVIARPSEVIVRANGGLAVAGTAGGQPMVVGLRADGSLDPGFGTGGIARWQHGLATWVSLRDIVELPDGRLLVAGRDAGNQRPYLARLTADGRLDTTFGVGGRVVMAADDPREFRRVTVDGQGRIVVAAYTNALRFLADGRLDTSFGVGGQVAFLPDSEILDIAVRGTGYVAVGSWWTGTVSAPMAVGLRADGSLDPSFGTGGYAPAPKLDQLYDVNGAAYNRVSVLADGSMIVAGRNYRGIVTRLRANGTVDPTFGVVYTTYNIFEADLEVAGGWVTVGGTHNGYAAVYRYDLAGRLDDRYDDLMPGFDLGQRMGFEAPPMAVDADGRLVLVAEDMTVARYRGGTLDPKPSVSIGDASVVEGTRTDGPATELRFPVTLSAPSAVPVTAAFSLGAGGTADLDDLWQRGIPYVRSVTFPPGSTSATLAVPVVPDAIDESDETIVYELTRLNEFDVIDNGLPGDTSATGTIIDDDGAVGPQPGVPVGVSVTAGRGRVTASWSPPPPGAAPVLQYSVLVVQSSAITGWVFVPADVRSASVDRLVNGRAADVFVAAWTKNGLGPWSGPHRVTPTTGGSPVVAATPPILSYAVQGPGNVVRVALAPPASDGGSPIVRYSVVVTDAATGVLAAWRNVGPDVRFVTLAGPSTTRRYRVSVSAVTSAGFGTAAVVDAIAPGSGGTTLLTPPAWEVATAGRRSLTATWGPAQEHGRVVAGYAVVVWQAGQIRSWQVVGADARQVTATGLLANVAADVVIVAYDTTGAYGQVAATSQRATPTA